MSISLYGFAAELNRIENALDDENAQESQRAILELIQGKVDAVVYYAQSKQDYIDAIDKRIEELKEAKKIANNKLERFDNYLLSCFDLLGATKLQGNLTTLSVRKPVQVVEVYDEKILSPDFFRVKTVIEVDKATIKEKLKNGEEVQGAKLTEGKRSIQFKTGVR